jgi:hypothetical protein
VSVVLPPEAAMMMSLLGPWPNMNEDEVRAEGQAARAANVGTAPAVGGADAAVRATQQVYRGESAAGLTDHWNRAGGESGQMAQANAAMKVMPVALEGTASVVSAVKVAAGTQAVFTAVTVAKALAFGGAVGATAATARVLASRQAVRKILREGREGTDKVIGPILRDRGTKVLSRIRDDLRHLGGRGGRPAMAGPHGGVPVRSSGLRNPSGPRSAKDGIAKMGRRNNRDNGRGNSGRDSGRGGGFFSRRPDSSRSSYRVENDGRIHGEPPSTASGMTEQEAKKARDQLKKSIKTRKKEEDRLGQESGHSERIKREEKALRDLEDSMRRRQYDQPSTSSGSSSSSSSGGSSSSSSASADRYPTDEEWAKHQRDRKW